MKTAVIVQARFGSSRLRGKVLMPLAGHTVLWHVLTRCAKIPGADVVVCCVPEGAQDESVAKEAVRCGAVVTRGSETDVLARYAAAAQAVDADVIMRITSDCPLIDPEICGQVLALVTSGAANYATNNMPRSFPHGLDCEAFTRHFLVLADEAACDPYEREHVSPWIRAHAPRRVNLWGPGGPAAEKRITLDTIEDYEVIRAIVEGGAPI